MSTKKWNFMNRFTAKGGGCGCGPSSTDAAQPKPISRTPFSDQKSAGGASSSAAAFSPQTRSKKRDRRAACRKIDDSLAVVKDSDDPYDDFRQSMIQMILEKEMYSGNELRHLLHCFLELNSPRHHEVIVRAFMDIWNGGAAVADGAGERFPPLGPRDEKEA